MARRSELQTDMWLFSELTVIGSQTVFILPPQPYELKMNVQWFIIGMK